ncbi:MAG: hypothetical protein PUB41_01940, partial [bacterium]|nr:hypothetical protein [bacterium]
SKIDLLLQKQGKSVVLQVSNPAADISPEDAQRMFDRFYRTDKPTTQKQGATDSVLPLQRMLRRLTKVKSPPRLKTML